jgi:uncharacterized protein (TIGR02118 family)
MVVLYRRPGMSAEEFHHHLRHVNGPLAAKMPGLRKYVQNYPAVDPRRKPHEWDAIVELHFEDHSALEAAWAGPEGAASDADLPLFIDLERSSWSVVEEVSLAPGES